MPTKLTPFGPQAVDDLGNFTGTGGDSSTPSPSPPKSPLQQFVADGSPSPAQSPEANAAVQQGGVSPAASSGQLSQTSSTGGGAGTTTQNTLAPQPQQSTPAPPLSLLNKPFIEQAKILGDFLVQSGVPVQPFAVGGHSSLDTQIIALIDRVNDPNVSDVEKKNLASQIAGLTNQRSKFMESPADFIYDPMSGQRTSANLTSGLYNPTEAVQGAQTTASSASNGGTDRSALRNYIEQMFNGGGASDHYRDVARSQLLSGIGSSTTGAKQELSDRLGSQGVQGGVLEAGLNNLDVGASSQKANGLANIELGVIDRQQQAKTAAISAALQEAGMSSSEAQQAASLLVQRQVQQAQLAQQESQFGQSLSAQQQNQGVQAQLQQRQQDIDLVLHLLDLAQSGDANAQQQALALLNSLGAT